MAWLSPEIRWLFRRWFNGGQEPSRANVQIIVQVIRWQYAGTRPPDLRRYSQEEVDRLMSIQQESNRLAQALYQAYRVINNLKPRWHDLAPRHQLVWIERAGRILVDLP